jgi:hypothetical protein
MKGISMVKLVYPSDSEMQHIGPEIIGEIPGRKSGKINKERGFLPRLW